MEAEGTRRLVVVSAVPVGPQAPGDPLIDRLSRKAVGAVLAELYADLARMEAVLPPARRTGPRCARRG